MIFVSYFKIEEATKVFERFSIFDRRHSLFINEKFWLELKRFCGILLNTKSNAFINSYHKNDNNNNSNNNNNYNDNNNNNFIFG